MAQRRLEAGVSLRAPPRLQTARHARKDRPWDYGGALHDLYPFVRTTFFIAAGLAFILRGNILASILGTFFGNPLTYVPIAVISMKTGYFFLGIEDGHRLDKSLVEKFFDAGENLLQNCIAFFTGEYTDWSRLEVFYHEVFFPYLVGGILPGLVLSIVGYYVTLPLIRAYQKRRRGTLAARLASLKKRKHAKDKGTSQH